MLEQFQNNLNIGQVIKSMDKQVTVPVWHLRYNRILNSLEKLGGMPIIRISRTRVCQADDWAINTNSIHQSGLICFVPKEFLGMAVLSVKINRINKKSVFAHPVEWIEVNPKLDADTSIGMEADDIFSDYCSQVTEDYRAIWHNKEVVL